MIFLKYVTALLLLVSVFHYSCSSKQGNQKSNDLYTPDNIDKKPDTLLNGLYVGFEYKGISADPAYPGKVFKLYHKGYIKIRGDSAFLDQGPVFVHGEDTISSASDGGFYYYSGLLKRNNDTVTLSLKELFCDYCGVFTETKPDGTKEVVKRTRIIKGLLTEKGIVIDSSVYKKAEKMEDLVSEHPEPYLEAHKTIYDK